MTCTVTISTRALFIGAQLDAARTDYALWVAKWPHGVRVPLTLSEWTGRYIDIKLAEWEAEQAGIAFTRLNDGDPRVVEALNGPMGRLAVDAHKARTQPYKGRSIADKASDQPIDWAHAPGG